MVDKSGLSPVDKLKRTHGDTATPTFIARVLANNPAAGTTVLFAGGKKAGALEA